jgi:hypothetical protein
MADILATLEAVPCPSTEDPACATTPCTPCDADGDGTPDVTALRSSKNPNDGSALVCPKYGCGARIAPERPGRSLDGTAVLVAFGALVLVAKRSRRR